MSQSKHYDIIIIGSGIGALTLASIMTKVNKKRVLVLERHSKIGGYTHSFSRKKYKWDVGLHYVGRLLEGKIPGNIFNFITNGKLKWQRMIEPFETFIYPDFTFEVFGEDGKYQRDLINMFPEEERAIKAYFKDIRLVTSWYIRYYLCRFLPVFLRVPLEIINKLSQKKALMTSSEYLKKRFKNPKLRCLVTSQWGNYGLPPSKSAFLIHAIVVNHFIEGGYYPEGGSKEIANNIVPIVEQNGGNCLVNHEVSRIIIKKNRAVGVLVNVRKNAHAYTEEYYAPVIVSNAGVFNSYTKLIQGNLNIPFIKKCITMNDTSTCVALYVGLKDDISSLGVKCANHWIYDSYDHDKHYRNNNLLIGSPSSCYLSFVFQKDFRSRANTAIIIAYIYYSEFKRWKHQTSGNRDTDYYELKDTITSGLINFVDRHYPGFSKMVDYAELATPLTSEHFTAHPEGAMYGLPATPERYRQRWLKVKTPVKGFYITGTDISSLGVVPSMLGGFATASALNGPFGFLKLVREMRRNNGYKSCP